MILIADITFTWSTMMFVEYFLEIQQRANKILVVTLHEMLT